MEEFKYGMTILDMIKDIMDYLYNSFLDKEEIRQIIEENNLFRSHETLECFHLNNHKIINTAIISYYDHNWNQLYLQVSNLDHDIIFIFDGVRQLYTSFTDETIDDEKYAEFWSNNKPPKFVASYPFKAYNKLCEIDDKIGSLENNVNYESSDILQNKMKKLIQEDIDIINRVKKYIKINKSEYLEYFRNGLHYKFFIPIISWL